jgi:hypothetical protein
VQRGREQGDQQNTHPEIGNRHPELACDADDRITDATLVQRGPDPGGQCDEQRDDYSDDPEGHGGGQPFEQRLRDRVTVAETHPEVAGECRTDIAEELFGDRSVQTACGAQCVIRLRCVARAESNPDRIAGDQVHEHEHYDEHADKHDDRVQQPACHESQNRAGKKSGGAIAGSN